MLIIFLAISVFVVLIVLFVPLVRLTKKKGTPPRLWESALLCAWALIWLSVSYIRKILEAYFTNIDNEMYAVLIIGFVLSVLTYIIIFWLLKRKPNLNHFERKLDEIGRSQNSLKE